MKQVIEISPLNDVIVLLKNLRNMLNKKKKKKYNAAIFE